MQKYSDLKKYYHFSNPDMGAMTLDRGEQFTASSGPATSSTPFVRNTVYSPINREAPAPASMAVGKSSLSILHIVLVIIGIGSGIYIRNQSLYNQSSVYHDLYTVFKGRFGEPSFAFIRFPKARAGMSDNAYAGSVPLPPLLNGSPLSEAPPTSASTSAERPLGLIPLDEEANNAHLLNPQSATALANPQETEAATSITPQTSPQQTFPKQTTIREQNGELVGEPTPPASIPAAQLAQAKPFAVPGSPQTTSDILAQNFQSAPAIPNNLTALPPTSVAPPAPVVSPIPSVSATAKVLNPTTVKALTVFIPILQEDKNSVVLVKRVVEFNEPFNPIGKIFEKAVNQIVTMSYAAQGGLDFFPERIKVNRVWIENKTLIIDVNRAFEYSRYGRKALEVRLQLLLWGSLLLNNQISEVHAGVEKPIAFVSLLIEGKRKVKLGGDGWVLNPFYSIKDLKTNISFIES